MTDQVSLENIKKAVQEFYSNEVHILENDLHIKCLGARLVRYLEKIDETWEVYLDYNYQYQTAYKTVSDTASISLFPEDVEVAGERTTKINLYPQICILREGERFLAIEIHKSTSRVSPSLSLEKVKTLTNRESPIHYMYGIAVQLITGKDYQASAQIQVHKPNKFCATFDFN